MTGRHLPPAAWTGEAGLSAVVAALTAEADGPGAAVRYVGGAVRDTLLGLVVQDVDLATPLPPDAVLARLAAAGIKAVPTGIAHGTVTAVAGGRPHEITTLRRDVATDGRHARVAFSSDWQEDAARRDFTINALYADPATGQIFDYFGGLADLAARRVRFIGDPRARIAEDHLRILRYFRFQARFGGPQPDAEADAACAAMAATLKGLSRERVAGELLKLLALPGPAPTTARMAELGILPVILPEADAAALAALVAAEAAAGIAADPVRRLAALLPADPDLAAKVAARLRLSGAQKKRLMVAAARGWGGDPRALAYRLGRTGALDQLLLTGGDAAAVRDWPIPTPPFRGRDLVSAGIGAGPAVAHLLSAAEADWIAAGFPADFDIQCWLADRRP